MLPATPGIAAWGVMTGVAMAKSGLSTTESIVMTLVVYAGSAQLASLPLIAAGAPAWVILATAFCVNLRFVVFSAHLRDYLLHLPPRYRLPLGFFTGDISYVMFVQRYRTPASDDAGRQEQIAFLWGHSLTNCASWMMGSIVGVVAAGFVPPEWGLGFAGVLALLGISFSLVNNKLRAVAAGVAAGAAITAYALPLKLNVLVAIAAAVVVCLALERWQKTVVQA